MHLQLSDRDFNSDSDEEDFLDVYRVDATGLSGKYSHSNTCANARMVPNNLPEYLQPLMERLAEDLTLWEHEGLEAAIFESRDVFSSGPNRNGPN